MECLRPEENLLLNSATWSGESSKTSNFVRCVRLSSREMFGNDTNESVDGGSSKPGDEVFDDIPRDGVENAIPSGGTIASAVDADSHGTQCLRR